MKNPFKRKRKTIGRNLTSEEQSTGIIDVSIFEDTYPPVYDSPDSPTVPEQNDALPERTLEITDYADPAAYDPPSVSPSTPDYSSRDVGNYSSSYSNYDSGSSSDSGSSYSSGSSDSGSSGGGGGE